MSKIVSLVRIYDVFGNLAPGILFLCLCYIGVADAAQVWPGPCTEIKRKVLTLLPIDGVSTATQIVLSITCAWGAGVALHRLGRLLANLPLGAGRRLIPKRWEPLDPNRAEGAFVLRGAVREAVAKRVKSICSLSPDAELGGREILTTCQVFLWNRGRYDLLERIDALTMLGRSVMAAMILCTVYLLVRFVAVAVWGGGSWSLTLIMVALSCGATWVARGSCVAGYRYTAEVAALALLSAGNSKECVNE